MRDNGALHGIGDRGTSRDRRCGHAQTRAISLRHLRVIAIALIGGSVALAGCTSGTDADAPRPESGQELVRDVLDARDLGPFLDDVEGRVDEAFLESSGGFLREIERQAVVDDQQRSIVARDFSSVVTIAVVRFRNAEFGRALLRPKGTRDPSPPPLPPGSIASYGDLESDYAERAALFRKGPTSVRLEVIVSIAGAPRKSGELLERASRLQYAKLREHRSFEGRSIESDRLRWRMNVSTIGSALVVFLLAALLTAARDRTWWRSLLNLLGDRPTPPRHSIDVDFLARGARAAAARSSRRRALVALAVFAGVVLLPLGPVRAGLVLVVSLLLMVAGATLGRRILGLGTPPLYRGGDVLIGAAGAALALALGIAGLFVGWFGINLTTLGGPGFTHEELERFRNMCIAAGVGLVVLSRVPLDVARRLAMRRLTARSRTDDRPRVLLLRSFADDDVKIRVREAQLSAFDRVALRRWERFEQALAHALIEIGPVEAVGEPGRFLPPLGATRTYYADDEWRGGVRERIDTSALVVMSVGRTPAVTWEVRLLREQGALRRTVFVIPPVEESDRSARLHLLAQLLEIDPRLLDHEEPGIEVLAVVVPDGANPVLLTSGVRDEASYIAALLAAVRVLTGEAPRPGPAEATASRRRALPDRLILEPGSVRRPRPWFRRPKAVVAAVVTAAALFVYGGFSRKPAPDQVTTIVDLPTVTRLLTLAPDAVIAIQDHDDGSEVVEVDAASGRTRRVAIARMTAIRAAASPEWVVLTNPTSGEVTGVDRRSGRMWTRRLPGGPQRAAVGRDTVLVALAGDDALAELRLRDGGVVRRVPVSGAPYDVAPTRGGYLVALAAAGRVVALDPRGRPVGTAMDVAAPRQVAQTAAGPWALSATRGSVARLAAGRAPVVAATSDDFLPKAAFGRRFVALAHDDEDDPRITVLDARTGEEARTVHVPHPVQALAVTDDGRLVVGFRNFLNMGIYAVD